MGEEPTDAAAEVPEEESREAANEGGSPEAPEQPEPPQRSDENPAPLPSAEEDAREDASGEPGPDALVAAWERVVERWDDDQAHKRFVGLCLSLGRLQEAGKRYREVRDHDRERGESAARRIDELLKLATRTLQTTRTPPPDVAGTKRRLVIVAFAIFLALMLYAAFALLRSL